MTQKLLPRITVLKKEINVLTICAKSHTLNLLQFDHATTTNYIYI